MKLKFLLTPIIALSTVGTVVAVSSVISANKVVDINDAYSFDENNVVLTFAGVTDVHINSYAPEIRKSFEDTLDYLKEINNDKEFDSVVIGGDLVDSTWTTTGTSLADFNEFSDSVKQKINPNKTSLFYTLGNHDCDPTGERGDDCKNVGKHYFNILGKEFFQKDDNFGEMYDEYNQATSSVTNNRSMTLNGYHFIAITPDYFWNSRGGFSQETINFLKAKLDQSIAEDPNKPIFVISHSAITNTSRGSDNEYWTYSDLEYFLKDYHQVVYLSGHIHNCSADDLSICQRDFTMIDMGSTKNTEMFNYYSFTNYKWNNYNTAEPYENAIGTASISSGMLFKVDNKGNIQVRRVLLSNSMNLKGELDPWYIDAPKADKAHLVRYNNEYRIANNKAPEFGKKSFFYLSERESEIFATFSAATDDSYVEYYEFIIKTEYEETITTKRYATMFFKEAVTGTSSKTPIFNLGSLSSGKYIIELRAGDVWHATSEKLVATIVVL